MEHTFVILFSLATLVAIAVSRTRVPYTVALVVVGLIVGSLHVVEAPQLTKSLLFSLFLPGLIFEAAYNLHLRELRKGWRMVSLLAGPGVVAAILLTAVGIAWAFGQTGLVSGFDYRDGLVFAALVSATDPIAVVSLFRAMGVDARLTTVVEAESLFNDGTAIVMLSLILAYVSGESSSIASLAGRFVVVIVGGAAIGAAISYGIERLMRRVNDPMVEITLTTIAAYGSFVVAEDFKASGVIATVVAGLMLGTAAGKTAYSERSRVTVDAFWSYVAFALNSIVFLLIGFEVRPDSLLRSAGPILIAFAFVILARVAIVFGASGLLRRSTERLSTAWTGLIAWGGLRGALAMVLALALPPDFPRRALLVDLTFGVVIISLLLQGLTIPFLTEALLRRSPYPADAATPSSEHAPTGQVSPHPEKHSEIGASSR